MSHKRPLPFSGMDIDNTPPHKKQRTSNNFNTNWQTKYNQIKKENILLKQKLLNAFHGISDNIGFPNIDEFVQEYGIFINQTHSNLLSEIMDIFEEINDKDNDIDIDIDITTTNNNDDLPDIELIKIQTNAYKVLHNLIFKCYNAMIKRRNKFTEIIRDLLHIKNTKKSNQNISMFIDGYLQTKWNSFINNKYYKSNLIKKQKLKPKTKQKKIQNNDEDEKSDLNDNNNNNNSNTDNMIHFDHQNMDKLMSDIYNSIKLEYNELFSMFDSNNIGLIYKYIGKCCVLFWIMILFKNPKLKLSHNTFWIKNEGNKYKKISNSIDQVNVENKEKELIKYCGVPGIVIVNNDQNKSNDVVLVEPCIFIHDHPSVYNVIKD